MYSIFPPIIKHASISRADIGEHMRDWCIKNNELKRPRDSLIGSYKGERIWLITPLIKFLLEKGLRITKVHQFLQYDKAEKFSWFKDVVTEKRSAADKQPEFALVADLYKLMGNTSE